MKRFEKTCKACTTAAIILLMSAACSCGRVQYVPVERVRVDSVVHVRVVRDSVHVTDSVAVRVHGDTVWHDRWRAVYKESAGRDTVWRERRDTVSVPYAVERRGTLWERVGRWAGGIGIGAGIALLCVGAAALAVRRRG